ncbi:FUSC family protein [Gluconobacter morbifer]|uniref:Putative transmembrane protein n=1 Tax=Gluconobacter morbifer G707 TaxID=1088869 RepID=G6XH31_9PROT|nr:FUSC family protein [Gluconobacter morbifer]EHH69489.1 putative transmembrane protein [Gluconobacter morbifer G707]
MARPVPDFPDRLSPARLWHLVCDPTPGRLPYAIRMAAACTATVLIGEIWQVPDLAVPTLAAMALWQKDRVTNALAGVGLNVIILVLIALVYGLVRLTLDHPMGLVIVIALLSFMFFFLGSASKLKPVAYMLGLIIVYALIAIDQVPVGEVVTRALLYTDLFLAVPGAVMVVLGLLICPSPKILLTDAVATRLRISVQLLESPDGQIRERATDMLRTGTTEMMKNAKMAALEKLWSAHDLACLKQAAGASVSVLALAIEAADSHSSLIIPPELLNPLRSMVAIFAQGDYPTDIQRPHIPAAAPALQALADLLPTFTTPALESKQTSAKQASGFFAPDAFTNPEHVRFAVKGTAAVMTSYFLFKILNWQGIHTCIITCFIVALPTMGEMISKLTLRIVGALIGGSIGILSIIFLMPHFNDVTAFLALVFVASLIGAWIKAGDERIAYAGFQIGLAFYLTDLKGYGPTTDMATARDRIVGIMIGNFITYAMFTSFWPSSAYHQLPTKLRAIADTLKRERDAPDIQHREAACAETQTAISEGERTLEYAMTEPAHMRADLTHLQTCQDVLKDAARLSADLLQDGSETDADSRIARLEQTAS